MKTYIVQTYGYTHCPAFDSLKEARIFLRDLVAGELESAKRKSRTAQKHKDGEDSYSITLGSDRRSALWSAHTIISA